MIERKTIDDLVQSISRGRERFGREWVRAQEMFVQRTYLVAECTFEDLATGNYRSDMIAKSVIQTLIAWQQYYGFHLWLPGKPEWAARVAESILEKHVTGILRREQG
jgi:ERCC4-type nuclease